jgi:sulfoxide reductase heme-binding subunit YedZ
LSPRINDSSRDRAEARDRGLRRVRTATGWITVASAAGAVVLAGGYAQALPGKTAAATPAAPVSRHSSTTSSGLALRRGSRPRHHARRGDEGFGGASSRGLVRPRPAGTGPGTDDCREHGADHVGRVMSTLLGNPLWFATRATGSVALILLTATVVLGIVGAGRYAPGSVGRFEVGNLRRNLSVLCLALLALHIGTALADSYVPLGWISGLIPFASPYRTLWVGLGTVAFDLLLAVALTSAVRLRIGLRRWKAAHWLAYAAWPAAVFHAAGTGTDTKLGVQAALYVLCIAAVLSACWWRLYNAGPGHLAPRAWAAVLSVALPVVFYAFMLFGPLAPGWSHRALEPQGPVAVIAVGGRR